MTESAQTGWDPNVIMGLATLAKAIDPNGVGGALGGLTQQMQGANSEANILQKMLGNSTPNIQGPTGITGQDVNLKTGGTATGNKPGSITLSDDGTFSMKGDRKELPAMMNGGGQQQQLTNPFATRQPNISLSELAGLNKQDIAQAVGLMLQSQGLGIEDKYKSGLLDINRRELEASKAAARQAEAEKIPFQVGGRTVKLNPKEFLSANKNTTSMKEYNKAVSQGYEGKFEDWKREMTALGGGLALESKLKETKALSKVKSDIKNQEYFSSGKLTKDIKADLASDKTGYVTFGMEPDEKTKYYENRKVEIIESEIKNRGAKLIEDTRWDTDGKTMIWTVEWPSGEKQVIRYVIR